MVSVRALQETALGRSEPGHSRIESFVRLTPFLEERAPRRMVRPPIHCDEVRRVICTSKELGADISSTSLEKLRPVTIYPIRSKEGIDAVGSDVVFPTSDVHVSHSSRP